MKSECQSHIKLNRICVTSFLAPKTPQIGPMWPVRTSPGSEQALLFIFGPRPLQLRILRIHRYGTA